MINRIIFLLVIVMLSISPGVQAAPGEPSLPTPIAQLKEEGAQMRYLGRDLGFDAWIAIKDGQEQYFYVTPDGSAFFLGVLFNKNGRAITFDQLKRLQGKKDPIFDDLMNAPSQKLAAPTISPPSVSRTGASSRADQLWVDVTGAASFTLGPSTAPKVYVFIDPACPHCKDMITALLPAIDAGQVALQVMMVGALTPDSAAWAAGILANPNPGIALRQLVTGTGGPQAGDAAADPRIAQNFALMQKWGFDGTPVSIYRDQQNKIKILQGPPKTVDVLLKDLR
jgi:thiol:disulfide interchange protein DsbG